MSEDRISALIDELEHHFDGIDEEAAYSLIALGKPVIQPLIERVASLDASAQLGAIEVFLALEATEASASLIAMLQHPDDRVRDWAAGALGDLEITDAVPHLKALLERSHAAGTPPDWTEPTNARSSLTRLGARTPVIPDGLKTLLVEDTPFDFAVQDADLDHAFDTLHQSHQVIAYIQRWIPRHDTWFSTESPGWQLDWTLPWDQLVEQSFQEARTAPRRPAPDAVATIEWLDRSDWVTP